MPVPCFLMRKTAAAELQPCFANESRLSGDTRELNCIFRRGEAPFSCHEKSNRIITEWQKRMEREIGEESETDREGRRKDESESAEIIVHQRSAHESPVGIHAHPLFVA